MAIITYLGMTVLVIAGIVGARMAYVWYTRSLPLQPSLDLEWAADCRHLTTATVEGTHHVSHGTRFYLAHHPRPR